MIASRALAALTLGVSLWLAAGHAPLRAQSFPDPVSTTVNDFADLLPDAEEWTLSDQLDRLERETGVELTVVTLATQSAHAPDMTLEAFATALFDRWGVGKADTNDGVMILVLRDDRAMRLELGAAYGQDWDGVARNLVDRHFLTAFRAGDFPRGIVSGTTATIEQIVLPFRDGAAAPSAGSGGSADWLVMAGVLLIVMLAVARNRIGDVMVRLRRCPSCGEYGLSQTRTTLTRPTRTATGLGERVRRCRFCAYEERLSFQISRIRPSSSGSFGGGRSGGGGASGRW